MRRDFTCSLVTRVAIRRSSQVGYRDWSVDRTSSNCISGEPLLLARPSRYGSLGRLPTPALRATVDSRPPRLSKEALGGTSTIEGTLFVRGGFNSRKEYARDDVVGSMDCVGGSWIVA
ncbi:hypothetical protein BJV74DRAFT_393948 [Russula compacta]|nr:hypothetical protein BJV74DRAFT_393948 [Russula compacta]